MVLLTVKFQDYNYRSVSGVLPTYGAGGELRLGEKLHAENMTLQIYPIMEKLS